MKHCVNLVMASVLVFVALVVAPLSAMAEETKTEAKTYQFDANGRVSVENINGSIEVSGWDKNEISLQYTMTADDKDDLENIKVDIEHSQDNFDVEVDINSDGFMNWGSNSGQVDFVLKVPQGASLRSIESVNGNIQIADVINEVSTSTVNGGILIKNAANDVTFGTVNGDAQVYFDQLPSSSRVKGDSVNGDIDIYLPENDGFELRSDTVNGDLSNDFDINVDEGEYVGADMDGKYKSGGASLKLDTVNGDISVRKD